MRYLLLLLPLFLTFTVTAAAYPIEAKPASIIQIPLGEHCVFDACDIDAQSRVKTISNTAVEAKVVDGSLNIAVPEAAKAGQSFRITLQAPNKKISKLSFVLPRRLLVYKSDEDGGGDDYPDLAVSGLQQDGALTDRDLRITIKNPDLRFDRSKTRISLFLPPNEWRSLPYKVQGQTIILETSLLNDAIKLVQNDLFGLSIELWDKHYGHGGNYSIALYRPRADLQGRLLDGPTGDKPFISAQPQRLNLTDANDVIRRVIPVQPDGSFAAQGLPIGQYDLELVDLDHPGFTIATFTVKPSDKIISGFLRNTTNTRAANGEKFIGASFQGDGTPLPSR